jgi:hypothetical protein
MFRGREKYLTEAIGVADSMTRNGTFIRNWVESVTASDIFSKVFGLNRSEAISIIDGGTFSKFISKNMTENITVVDVKTLSVDYARYWTEAITASDARTFTIDYARNWVESVSVVDIIDAVKDTGGTDYEKNLTEAITASDTRTFTVDYARFWVESVTASGVCTPQKIPEGGVDYEKDLTESIGVIIIGSVVIVETNIFYELFLSLNMWGYIGPIALVIIGVFLVKKEKSLGVIWILLESLIIATYFSLLEATPDYWWHIIILLMGVIISTFQLMDR